MSGSPGRQSDSGARAAMPGGSQAGHRGGLSGQAVPRRAVVHAGLVAGGLLAVLYHVLL